MAAASNDKFSEILTNVLRLLNLESISLREQQVNAIRVIVEKRRDVLAVLPTGFGKSLIFQLLPFVFNSWLEVSDSVILVVSPLNALMRDQMIKLDSMQVPSIMIRGGESSDFSVPEMEGIKQCKYRIIYGHPEAFIGILRKVLDSPEVRETIRAVAVDEAHLIEEW